jgi:hypothetical protein
MKESFDKILQNQEEELASMHSKTAEIYAMLQLDEQEFLKCLNDQNRYSPEEWATLQKHRLMLQKGLEIRLKKAAKGTPSKDATLVQPHWIFVK